MSKDAYTITVDVSYRQHSDGTFIARGRGLPGSTAGRSRHAAEGAVRACLQKVEAYINALSDSEVRRLLADTCIRHGHASKHPDAATQ